MSVQVTPHPPWVAALDSTLEPSRQAILDTPVIIDASENQLVDGQIPPLHDRFKSDTSLLGAGSEIEIFMKFRTFKGPFVFHCHNLDHEDMRMMFNFDPRMTPTEAPQPIQQSFP